MTDETTLLPCPFCGSEIPAPTRRYMSVLICPTCNAYGPGNSDMTNDELIAAWNTRAYLNPDGLPVGLTISDDGNLLNWRGENYVKQSTLESECDKWKAKAEEAGRAMNAAAGLWAKADAENRELQAKCDELNAKLGSGTCKLIDTTSPGNDDYWNSAKCSECGAEFTCAIFGRDSDIPDANYCPNCGAKVVG